MMPSRNSMITAHQVQIKKRTACLVKKIKALQNGTIRLAVICHKYGKTTTTTDRVPLNKCQAFYQEVLWLHKQLDYHYYALNCDDD